MLTEIFERNLCDDPAVLSRRERKKRHQKYSIIRAAQELIEEKGYDATSVSEIAAAADISYATFFNYFPTKDDILLAINDMEYEDLLEIVNLRYSKDDPISVILEGIFLEWNEDSLKNRKVSIRIQETALLSSNSPAHSKTQSLLTSLISEGIRRGEFHSNTNPELTTALLSGLRNEVTLNNRMDLAGKGFRQIIDYIRK